MRTSRLTALPVVLLLGLLPAAAGCSPDDDNPPPPQPTTPTSSAMDAPLPLPELTMTDVAEITTATPPAFVAPGRGDKTVEVVGDLALVGRQRAGGHEVADLRSGRVLWRAGGDAERRLGEADGSLDGDLHLVRTASGPLAVGPYFSFDCAYGCPDPDDGDRGQLGLVGLDARTGDVVWGRALTASAQAGFIRPRDRADRLDVEVRAVGSQVVVAGVGDFEPIAGYGPDRTARAYAVGLDPAIGGLLWSRRGVIVDALAGDVVVGRVNDEDAPALLGLDARTGRQLWRNDEITPAAGAAALSTSPRVVVVSDPDVGVRLLDTRTGEPLDRQPPAGAGPGCAEWARGDLDVVCRWPGRTLREPDRLLTLDRAGTMSLSGPLDDDAVPELGRIFDGAVTVSLYDGVRVVDAAGRSLLTGGEDGDVVGLDRRYVVLDNDGRITVLRRQ